MTSLQLFLSRHEMRRAERDLNQKQDCSLILTNDHKVSEVIMMKAFLLGLILAAGGIQSAAVISADPDFHMFAMCMGGGILGVVIGWSVAKPKDFQSLSQEVAGNLASAIAFGPLVTPWIAYKCSVDSPDYRWFLAVSAGLGIVGLAVVKAIRSETIIWALGQMGFKKQNAPIDEGIDMPDDSTKRKINEIFKKVGGDNSNQNK